MFVLKFWMLVFVPDDKNNEEKNSFVLKVILNLRVIPHFHDAKCFFTLTKYYFLYSELFVIEIEGGGDFKPMATYCELWPCTC